jgi:hypothetical protein
MLRLGTGQHLAIQTDEDTLDRRSAYIQTEQIAVTRQKSPPPGRYRYLPPG